MHIRLVRPALLCFLVAWLSFCPVRLERFPVFLFSEVLANLPESRPKNVCELHQTQSNPNSLPLYTSAARTLHISLIKFHLLWACIRLRALLLICDVLSSSSCGTSLDCQKPLLRRNPSAKHVELHQCMQVSLQPSGRRTCLRS